MGVTDRCPKTYSYKVHVKVSRGKDATESAHQLIISCAIAGNHQDHDEYDVRNDCLQG